MRRSLISLSSFFIITFSILALTTAYWTTLNRDSLLARNDNPRALIAFNRLQRGRILDRNGTPLAQTIGQPGQYERKYELSAALVIGYASFQYGLSGIEEAMNSTLSGDESDSLTDWWKHDLLGEPKVGGDVKLTLDLNLQRKVFNALNQNKKAGAVVIIAPSGEILALASTPSFDPATLEKDFPSFSASSKGELINRATYALYSTGALIDLFPSTLALTVPPALPIPTRAADRNKTTPLQMALLTTSLLNDGMMPSPALISNPQSPISHPIAIMSRDTAAQLRQKIKDGYAVTVSGQQTLGWFIGFVGENAICVVIENGTGEEARQIATSIK
jgi:cell division protein FtsI/penicillin-binding protein 2